jgi:L-ascorbate metabolism protein UlaG (beta-lactamase superfamily)
MKITMIGHCTVLIETEGKKLITDPYFDSGESSVYERIAPPAKTRQELQDVDLVLLSHNHWDHKDDQYLRMLSHNTPVVTPHQVKQAIESQGVKKAVGINPWETSHFDQVTVTAVPASHMVPATGFVIQSEGKQVYFAGDTYYHSFMKRIGQRFQLDVALIPVTTYRLPMTMDSKSAVRAVQAIAPKIVIPIHLGIRPRSPLLRTSQTPEGFAQQLHKAGLETKVIILKEGQSWKMEEREE